MYKRRFGHNNKIKSGFTEQPSNYTTYNYSAVER